MTLKKVIVRNILLLNDLINLSTAKIELLTSSNAIKCYEKEYLNVSGLKC